MDIGKAIDTALHVPYLPGGRDLQGWDCWGAVRWLYAQHTGLWLPEFPHLCHDEALSTQHAVRRVQNRLEPCGFKPWALAAQYHGKTWKHVGIVLPDLNILHADTALNRTTTHNRRHFEMLALTTRYYRWKA